jgi:two-component system LytT family response regulator
VSDKKLTAIIVDDETKAISNLKKLLGLYCGSIQVVDTAVGSEPAISLINTIKPDVVFLDIAMPRRNGFEMLHMLDIIPLIVFVTAHEKYALNAIKISAVDYLLKPVDIKDLINMEKKLLEIHAILKDNFKETYRSVVGGLVSLMRVPEAVKKITLYNTQGYHIVDIDEILYLDGDDNYTSFHLDTKKKFVVSKTLKEYENLLSHMGFLRIHKSSIINLLHLKNISRENGVHVVMSDGRTISVSRRRAGELLDKAKQFLT